MEDSELGKPLTHHEEVAGVVAHELAHIRNRDTLTMTITATLAGAVSMLANFAIFFGGNRDNNNPFGFIGVIVAMIVAPLAAMLVQMAISRTREYAADKRGAEICGKPMALASATTRWRLSVAMPEPILTTNASRKASKAREAPDMAPTPASVLSGDFRCLAFVNR